MSSSTTADVYFPVPTTFAQILDSYENIQVLFGNIILFLYSHKSIQPATTLTIFLDRVYIFQDSVRFCLDHNTLGNEYTEQLTNIKNTLDNILQYCKETFNVIPQKPYTAT